MELRRRIALEANRLRNHNLRQLHPLRQLFWECTLRCNVHCRHCGSDCKHEAQQADMPREDFFRVLDSVAQKCHPNEVFIILSGGEPLMRDDLEQCGRGIMERGFPWGMVTNGLYLNEERLRSLRQAGLCSVAISLDGLEENHNWLRCHPESFKRASAAIDLLVNDGDIKFDVVTCVNQRNYDQLNDMKEFLIEKGVSDWRLFPIFPMGRAANDPLLQLPHDKFRGLLDFICHTRHEGRIHANYSCEGFLGDYEGEVRDWLFRCAAGITVGSVLIDGSIGACTSIRSDFSQGNIYQDDFMEVWENRYQPHRHREWMKRGACAKCKHWRYCEGNGLHLRTKEGDIIKCDLIADDKL